MLETMKKDSSYVEAFQHLGNSWDVTMETMDTLEDYVCLLYGEKNTNVNNARFEIFHKNMSINLKLKIFHCYHHVNLYLNYTVFIQIILPKCGNCLFYPRSSYQNIQDMDGIMILVLGGVTNRSPKTFLRS